MSLLLPLFLLGALAVAAPVLAHLVRRSTRERVRFSATRFLDPLPPLRDRRSRIRHPWLLLLRCLIVALLALGFARPFFSEVGASPAPAAEGRHRVVVLDAGAGMRRTGLHDKALARIRSLGTALAPGDRFALVSTDPAGRVPVSAERWAATAPPVRGALLDGVLATLEPGWGPVRLDTALEAALDELGAMREAGGAPESAEILVVSPFGAGARLSGLAGRDWPPGVVVRLERLDPPADTAPSPSTTPTVPDPREPAASRKPPAGRNASLRHFGWTDSAEGPARARVRLENHSAAPLPVRLRLRDDRTGDEAAPTREEILGPREVRVVALELPAGGPGAFRLELDGDDEAFDNTVWLLPPRPRTITAPYLGRATPEDAGAPLFYLTRALENHPGGLVETPVVDPAGDPPLPEAPLYFVADTPGRALVETLGARLEAGATVLLLLGDESRLETAMALGGETGWATGPVGRRADLILGEIDFRHPLFAPFADPRFSDFTKVRFWKPVPLVLPPESRATVAARFEDRTAAVVEIPRGRGALVVWGGDWQPAAGQWVVSTKFIPWLQTLVTRASGGPARPDSVELGALERLGAAADARWTPIATGRVLPPGRTPAAPGLWDVSEDGRTRRVALQVPGEEMSGETLAIETWERLGVPLATSVSTSPGAVAFSSRSGAAESLEREQQLWRWMLLLAGVLLASESIAAILMARRASGAASSEAGA